MKRVTTHPGEMLLKEFMDTHGLSQTRLAIDLGVPSNAINFIVRGKRSITPPMALRLSRYFGNSAEFWLNLQSAYDLSVARIKFGEQITREVHPRKNDDEAL